MIDPPNTRRTLLLLHVCLLCGTTVGACTAILDVDGYVFSGSDSGSNRSTGGMDETDDVDASASRVTGDVDGGIDSGERNGDGETDVDQGGVGTSNGGSAVGGMTYSGGLIGTDGDLKFPSVTDFSEPGTFPTTSTSDGPDCTIYRPEILGADDLKHPVIIWGNASVATASSYEVLFEHFASHGFIVVATDTSNSSSSTKMIACLEWILRQNATPESPYRDAIDVERIASSGHVQGGCACLMAGRDTRFAATLPVHPIDASSYGCDLTEAIDGQILPMFMISGSRESSDFLIAFQQSIFDTAKVPIVWGKLDDVNSLSLWSIPETEVHYRGPMTAWFRFVLMHDPSAGDYFRRDQCFLCEQSHWTVLHNDLWSD